MRSMRKGILLCCWLGLAACSSEAPDGEDDYEYEDEEYSDSAMDEPADPPTARVTVEGETSDFSGEGFCRRIGSSQTFGPEGRFEIALNNSDNTLYISVMKDNVDGVRVAFRKDNNGWEIRLSPEEDNTEFDGSRFVFEGTVMKNLYRDQLMPMRLEVDCPFVDDLVM